jgi:predicted enzyme related to lactoylglutathione lyase
MHLKCVNIVSADPQRLAGFYRTLLGANIDESHGGPHRIEIWFGDNRDGAVLLVVNYDGGYVPRESGACQGFEFQVPDVDAEYKRILALGFLVKEPPKDTPWGYRYFNIKDPDGNCVDIVQALKSSGC